MLNIIEELENTSNLLFSMNLDTTNIDNIIELLKKENGNDHQITNNEHNAKKRSRLDSWTNLKIFAKINKRGGV